MAEIVYILTNEAMPGMIKIGRTTDDLAGRIRGLSNTSVPLPFELYFACEVPSSIFVEAQLHEAFGDHRVSKNREFFRLAPERARAALLLAKIKEVKLGDEIFESPEEKSEVESAKRRTRFQFAMLSIPPGTELQLYRDPKIICKTVDDKNKVEFKGETISLSDAALQAVNELGYDWDAASGPYEWAYHGKRLDDLRREIDEKAD
jgi:T5orf172 domain